MPSIPSRKVMAALGCLVGSLLFARAVDDHDLSTAVRDASRQLLHDYLGERWIGSRGGSLGLPLRSFKNMMNVIFCA